MWKDINKTSAQSSVSEFLDNLEAWVLKPDEKLNETPASFTSLFASSLGKISAYSNFSMLMAKREITPSTAIMTKSLLRQLKSEDLNGIYGTPASTQIAVSYPLQDLINQAVVMDNGLLRLTLNKNTQFVIGNYPSFTLDYNINIYISQYKDSSGNVKYSPYAMYNTEDLEAGDILPISNPYLNTRTDIVLNNQQMFSMYLDLKQYTRTVVNEEMTGEPRDITVEYGNKLMGFVVLYRSQSSTVFQKVNCYFEGETYTDGLGYTLSNNGGVQTIKFRFSKLPDAFNPTNGVIKIIVYTTEGADGNYTLGQIDDNTAQDMNVIFNQDVSDDSQYALIKLIPTCSIISSEAIGGKDALDIEGIRELVVQSGKGEVITPTTLSIAAKKKGFSSFKKRHDMYSLEYTLSSFLTDSNNNIVLSKMIDAYFLYSDLGVETGSNSRIISPSDGFEYDADKKAYKYIPSNSLSVYNIFYSEYKKDSSKEQYKFPYFMRIQNGDSLEVSVYDESIDKTSTTQFIYVDDAIYDKASITSMNIYRNPIDTEVHQTLSGDTKYQKDFYIISFDVYVSDFIWNHLKAIKEGTSTEDQYVKFRVLIKNKSDGSIYAAESPIENAIFNETEVGTIHCSAVLHTNSSVLSNGKINIDDSSLKTIPYSQTQYSFYYIDPTVDIEVAVLFKSNDELSGERKYSTYLTQQEINNNYYVGVVYACNDIPLIKDISEEINIVSDLKLTQPTYERAEMDIPDVYTENVYKKNSEGDYEVQTNSNTLPDGSVSSDSTFTLIHKVGDVKQQLDGRVGTFNAVSGDSWKWSNEKSDEGVYDAGSVLGGLPINAVVEWNNLVIFAGDEGRLGCYDITYKTWHSYNEASTGNLLYRDQRTNGTGINSGFVIKGNQLLGTYKENGQTKVAAIRGLKVVNTSKGDCLIAYGDLGRVVSCKLSNNYWTAIDGSKTDPSGVALWYNNGSCINGLNEMNNLYCCEEYTFSVINSSTNVSEERTNLVFAGGSGRVCSLTLENGNAGWHNFDSDEGTRSRDAIFSTGTDRNLKSILAIAKHLENEIYCTGVDGVTSVIDLTSGSISLLNEGDVVDHETMYAAAVVGSTYVQAGRKGYVASYNIVKNQWTKYDANSGLSSDGSYIGNCDIFVAFVYGTNIVFGGTYGRICNYDTSSNSWESYDSQADGLTNDGSFIESTISCVSFDTEQGNNLIYFGAKAGNITYKYRKGDIIYDDNGNPKVKESSQQICYLNGIPAYSRVYSVPNNFFNIINTYNNLINKIKAMDTIFVDEGNLYLGVKTTSGASTTYYFQNNKTGEKEYLDSLAISLSIGVKFDDNITTENAEFLIGNIKEKIISYVKDVQSNSSSTDTELNINKMLDTIKTDIPSIKYFEYYKLNNYESTECQTIYHPKESDDELNNEYLCIQNVIDEANSNLSNNEVTFIPNIAIVNLGA